MKEFELAPDEHIVRESRKHWFVFLAVLLPFIIIAIIPFALPRVITLVPQLAQYATWFDYTATTPRLVLGIWLLITWTGAWSAFTRFYLSVFVLTNKRIANIKQHGYFSREVSILFLSNVQDVTTDVSGFLPSIFGMGDIIVQSAGAIDEFRMRNIPRPEQMRDMLLRYISEQSKNTSV